MSVYTEATKGLPEDIARLYDPREIWYEEGRQHAREIFSGLRWSLAVGTALSLAVSPQLRADLARYADRALAIIDPAPVIMYFRSLDTNYENFESVEYPNKIRHSKRHDSRSYKPNRITAQSFDPPKPHNFNSRRK